MGDFRSLALNGRSPIGGLGGFLARIDDTPFDLETIGHQAIGPYSTDRWRDALEAAKKRGVAVEEFDISRFSIRQSDLPKP
jgi:hypothetical protein